jgi:hypothetical protein
MSRRFKLDIAIESPFVFGGAGDLSLGVDRALPRNARGQLVLPGSLVKGTFRDAIESMIRRGKGQLAGMSDAEAVASALFGRASGQADTGFSRDLGSDGADNEPQRGQIFFTDFVCFTGARRTGTGTTLTRIEINDALGSADEGKLEVVELPVVVGELAVFGGHVEIANPALVDPGERLLRLALEAVSALGGHKSAGFGRIARGPETRLINDARKPVSPPALDPSVRSWRAVWLVEGPWLAGTSRDATNVFSGSEVVPGGSLKGAAADALASAGRLPDVGKALSRLGFGHAYPVLGKNADAALAATPLPTPFSVASFDGFGPDPVLVDLARTSGAVVGIQGTSVSAPTYQVDWKGPQFAADAARRGEDWQSLGMAVELAREQRTRVAIDYARGDASVEHGGFGVALDEQLFVTTLVAPTSVNDPAAPVRLISAIDATEDDGRSLLAELTGLTLFFGKTKTPVRLATLVPTPDRAYRVEKRAGLVLMLSTDGVLCSRLDVEACDGDVCAAYRRRFSDAFRDTATGCGVRWQENWVRLSQSFARQRLVGGYQAVRFRANSERYEPWLSTLAGSTFMFAIAAEADEGSIRVVVEELRCSGFPDIATHSAFAFDGDRDTTWQRHPMPRSNGFGAIAPEPLPDAPLPRWLHVMEPN